MYIIQRSSLLIIIYAVTFYKHALNILWASRINIIKKYIKMIGMNVY